ncbi:MAG: hypothetical protein P8Y12_05135, partial [Gammaproteobacteria bacterium]
AAMWFDATEEYALQLHEVSREDYLDAKRREYDNQVKLQSEITTKTQTNHRNHRGQTTVSTGGEQM